MLDPGNRVIHSDLVYEDEKVFSIVSLHWWPNNPGHVLIIPKKHIENIYELPFDLSDRIHRLEKHMALTLKAVYNCDGVSSRQHNEPAGNQDVWHYHLHVFPRYTGDKLYGSRPELAASEERLRYAYKLRSHFATHVPNLEVEG
jgi:histidine triad (HIT) family protein